MAKILVVDDEMGIRELLSEILSDEGHDVRLAENAAAARVEREKRRPDLVLLDIWMPDTDGITLLKEWVSNGQLTMPVIMMSGHGTIDTAVEAIRIGALDFLEKPIALQKLLAAIKKGLTRSTVTLVEQSLSLSAFTRSAPLRDLKKRVEQVANNSRMLLLRSPPGGIIELTARTLHVPGRPWIDLAQDSTPLTLDMLAGASGGVLFAEEIGRLSRLQQKNLLFAAERLAKFNLRMIVATSFDDAMLTAQGWDAGQIKYIFDVWLNVPSLFELRDEIPELASHLLTQRIESGEAPLRRFSMAALNALRQYTWPGGYDEMKSVIKSLALSSLDEVIDITDVRQMLSSGAIEDLAQTGLSREVMDMPLREAREIFERIYFEHHLHVSGSNMTRLAERTGLERTHLYRKLKDLGLRNGRREEE